MVYVTRVLKFNAAHRLHNPAMSDDWNIATFGKCNSPNWHGHNYTLEVTVAGSPEKDTGYVIDLGALDRIVKERVIDRVDHSNLNLDVDFMEGILPSTENFAMAIWAELEPHVSPGRLHSIILRETDKNFVEYRGERS